MQSEFSACIPAYLHTCLLPADLHNLLMAQNKRARSESGIKSEPGVERETPRSTGPNSEARALRNPAFSLQLFVIWLRNNQTYLVDLIESHGEPERCTLKFSFAYDVSYVRGWSREEAI